MKSVILNNVLFSIVETLVQGVITIFLTLDSFICTLISWIYQIILTLASTNILKKSDIVDGMINRLYIIIGVVMLFLLAYSLLKSLINPDENSKSKSSPAKLISNVIISIVLIALVPTIFDFAMDFQSAILRTGTLNSIVIGTDGSVAKSTIQDGGFTMASGVLQAFLRPAEDYCTYDENATSMDEMCSSMPALSGGQSYTDMWQSMKDSRSFIKLTLFADYTFGDDKYLDYMFLISSVALIFVLFVLISYCVEVAIRTVKLSVFQLIAPIPILARLLPNDQGKKIFDNWIKAVISTYVEIFIRLIILFFAILLITVVADNWKGIFGVFQQQADIGISFLALGFLILGIILFVKQAPQILKDITGLDSGKYNVLKSAKQGFSLLAGGVAGGGNPLAALRAYNQAGEAKLSDFSAIGNQYKRKIAAQEAKEMQAQAGLKGWSRFKTNLSNGVRRSFGFGSSKEEADRNLEKFKNIDGSQMEAVNDTGSEIIDRNGNIIVAENKNIPLTEATVNRLNEARAANEERKAHLSEQLRKADEALTADKAMSDFKKTFDSIAADEIETKNKINLVVASGAFLSLRATRDAHGNAINLEFGQNGATLKEYQAWLDANRDKIDATEYANLQKALNDSVKTHTVARFIDTNGEMGIGAAINQDIIKAKREMLQTYITTGLHKAIYDATTQTVNTDKDTTFNRVTQGTDRGFLKNGGGYIDAEDIDYELIKQVKNHSKDTLQADIEINVKNVIQHEQTQIEDANKRIDRIIEQGKQQVETEKTSAEYKAREASDKAHEITQQGKK